MNSSLTSVLLGFTYASLITGIPALLIYSLFRWMEKQWIGWSYFVGLSALVLIATTLYFILFIAPPPRGNDRLWIYGCAFAFLIVAPAVGAGFHSKAGGASKNWIAAFLLMEAIIAANVGAFLIFASIFPFALMGMMHTNMGVSIFFSVAAFVYPVMMPLVFWIWRTLRTRPGFDVPMPHSDNAS